MKLIIFSYEDLVFLLYTRDIVYRLGLIGLGFFAMYPLIITLCLDCLGVFFFVDFEGIRDVSRSCLSVVRLDH